jgi:hypothetical protein
VLLVLSFQLRCPPEHRARGQHREDLAQGGQGEPDECEVPASVAQTGDKVASKLRSR